MMHDAIRINSQPVEPAGTLTALLRAVSGQRSPSILDSADTGPGRGRFTLAACEPLAVLSCPLGGPDPFEQLRSAITSLPSRLEWASNGAQAPAELFPGGWIGYLAYEAGRYIEHLPGRTRRDVGLPVARFGLYDTVLIHDAWANRWTLVQADLSRVAHRLPGELERVPSTPSRAARLERIWHDILSSTDENEASCSGDALAPIVARPNVSRDQFETMVRRGIEYIAAGDIFQVNLARRESFDVNRPAIETYERLRQSNPGAYAAFLSWHNPTGGSRAASDGQAACAVMSSSPELFLELKDRHVITRPIKGTRPRGKDAASDRALRAALATSEKDRAELAMIVDLERNDLGRVCQFGSVRVAEPSDPQAWPYSLETHPTVHHLVTEVHGDLADGYDAIDLVRACFPGGSITGAPKVRAMEIIDELEPTERSVYTGAIGAFGLDGSVQLNIAIRTLIQVAGRIHLYAGGGIVADSQPGDEYRETQAKALGMHRALGADTALAAPAS